jgi:hypothetical protein
MVADYTQSFEQFGGQGRSGSRLGGDVTAAQVPCFGHLGQRGAAQIGVEQAGSKSIPCADGIDHGDGKSRMACRAFSIGHQASMGA